ncbi:MAG TPA: MBL fold metallo-hydrolase [Alphaproteobacteria bacterium]|jgi:phosphoribosyl 1,2-cyclic phosphate phosphodiesterase|nr:MBL fold metallo-hydrolase [Alphaproteobacteria bacterium]
MRVTILGSGAAGGVPQIGGDWGACDPDEPRNRRRRASILVESSGSRVLVDTSPDMREQLIDAEVSALDAILYTHEHADHVHGIDDVRTLNRISRRAIDAYGSAHTMNTILKRFNYVFTPPPVEGGKPAFFKPCLTAHEVAPGQAFAVGSLDVMPFAQDHGFMTTLGFRFGDFAYSTDVVKLDEAAFATLTGVKVWLIGCLGYHQHPTHAHLDRVLGWIEQLKPERAVLTHMTGALDYRTLATSLPTGVEPGYDGMVLDVSDA